MEQDVKPKAKRKITNLDFTGKDAAVALVSKEQGGPANGVPTLIFKAKNFSDEFVEKASKIKVELEITEYLQRFYGLWETDAEVLARSLGFKTKRQEKYELESKEKQLEDKEQELYPEYPGYDASEQDWEDYITSKISSIDIMKSLYESDNVADILSQLDEPEYLIFLQDQQMLEKAFKKIDKQQKESTKVVKTTAEGKPQIAGEVKVEVDTSVEVNKTKETDMTKEVKVVETEVSVEMIAKAEFDSIQKALEDQKVALTKAMETIAQFEAEKKAQIEKARKQEVVAAVKDEAKAEVLFKAVKDASDEDFKAVVKALADLAAAVEKSDLFVEKGATVEDKPAVSESHVERLLKAKFQKQ